MPEPPLLVGVDWSGIYDPDREVLTIVARDALTQRDYRVELPDHLLTGLIEVINEMRRSGELPDYPTTTRRVD